MKKFENLGKKLSKDEQKKIKGGAGYGGCLGYLSHCGLAGTPCCPGFVCSHANWNDHVCFPNNP